MSGVAYALAGSLVAAPFVVNWLTRRLQPTAPSAPPQPKVSVEVELTLALLATGEGWRTDGYRMWHPTGACLWIANEKYGMKLMVNATEPSVVSRAFLDAGELRVPLSDAEKAALWQAVKAHNEGEANAGRRSALGAFAKRVADMHEERPSTVVPFERRA